MRVFISTLIVCALLSASQAAAKNDTLPQVTVTGKKTEKTSLTVPNINTAIDRIHMTPGGVDVIDASDYERGRAATLQDVLGYSPGVYVQPRFGAEESRLSIRGSGIQRTFHLRGVNLLQDGVPLNQADGSGDFQAIETLAQQYVEVYRGANALQYGATTLGGAVNFVSRTGYNASPLAARFEFGSYGFLKTQVSSGLVQGPLDYYVSLTDSNLDGFRNHSEQINKRLFTNAGWKITPDIETRFYVTALDSKSKLPGNLTEAQEKLKPEMANPANITLNQKRNFDFIRLSNLTVFHFGAGTRLELGAYWFRKDLYHPIFQVLDIVSNDFGGTLKLVSEFEIFNRKNILVAGYYPQYGVADDNRYVNIGGQSGRKTASSDQFSMNQNIYAENSLYIFPKLALVTGIQFTYDVRRSDDNFLGDGDNSGNPLYQGYNPKAGFLYDLTPRSQIFGNISRSYEPPSFGELVNLATGGLTRLKAQSAWTLEAGTRGNEGRVSWDIAWYYAWVDDELLSLNNGAGMPLGTVNAPSTTHQGIEVGTRLSVIEGILRNKVPGTSRYQEPEREFLGINAEDEKFEKDRIILHGIYNWSRFRFDEDPVYSNNQLPGIPENFFRAELLYEHPCGIYVGPNLEWTFDHYPVDMNNTLFANPYAILGLKGGLQLKKGLSFFVEGRNLTDKIYTATTGAVADARGRDSAQFLPGDRRSVFAGIEWRF